MVLQSLKLSTCYFLSVILFVLFLALIQHFIWFSSLSCLSMSIVFLFYFYSDCPKVFSVHLQLNQVHFLIVLNCLTGRESTLKIIPTLPSCPLWHFYHSFHLSISYKNRFIIISILNKLLYVRLISNRK
jgi:hypothetical protein